MKHKHLNIGILAHVDAGKTTLSEALLLKAGAIRKQGRVDHGDAFLDTDALEKQRGITIFSKQAEFTLPAANGAEGVSVTLVDNPGHADFSPAMERTLSALDYAILVLSGPDGFDDQAPVLWRLLRHYRLPVFLFINKMDQPGTDREAILAALRKGLSSAVLDFSESGGAGFFTPERQEEIAVLDEKLMERFLEKGEAVDRRAVQMLIRERKLFPAFFGSALKLEGIDAFLKGLSLYTDIPEYPDVFGARVIKIARDKDTRLTFLKITGGSLKARSVLTPAASAGAQNVEGGDTAAPEKVNEIRIYSGAKFRTEPEAFAGEIVAVTGLKGTIAGEGFGTEPYRQSEGLLQPVFSRIVLLPKGSDMFAAFRKLKLLEEEEPMLRMRYVADEKSPAINGAVTADGQAVETNRGTITAEIMGEVQTEVLRSLAAERFGLSIGFGKGRVVYRETVKRPVIGVGHFEPLRHYAEVHLLIEPGIPGSGVTIESMVRTDELALTYQKQILDVLRKADLRGVLTGSVLTDVKITLIAGAASIMHTVGGDFYEAANRAVRQGLMAAENILLEPVLRVRIRVPQANTGRVLSDFQRKGVSLRIEEAEEGMTLLTGRVPASELGEYAAELSGFTGGRGSLQTEYDGYAPCHNTEEVLAARGYDPSADLAHPADSVFCSHGAAVIVSWDKVPDWMHLHPETDGFTGADADSDETEGTDTGNGSGGRTGSGADSYGADAAGYRAGAGRKKPHEESFAERERKREALDSELREIFERTYGKIHRRTDPSGRIYGKETERAADGTYTAKGRVPGKSAVLYEYLLVDGYNIIWAWDELRRLASVDIKAARDRLVDILSNFGGYRKEQIILVFDAYKVQGGTGEVIRQPHLTVIYTKEAETADLYIEKATRRLVSKNTRVTVATSDAVEQVIIYGAGAIRMSADGFYEEVRRTEAEMREQYHLGDAEASGRK